MNSLVMKFTWMNILAVIQNAKITCTGTERTTLPSSVRGDAQTFGRNRRTHSTITANDLVCYKIVKVTHFVTSLTHAVFYRACPMLQMCAGRMSHMQEGRVPSRELVPIRPPNDNLPAPTRPSTDMAHSALRPL